MLALSSEFLLYDDTFFLDSIILYNTSLSPSSEYTMINDCIAFERKGGKKTTLSRAVFRFRSVLSAAKETISLRSRG